MTRKLTAIAAVVALSSSTAFAAEQFIEVESFTGVSLGTGMVSNVTCGNSNTVTLRGKKKTLDKIKVTIEQGTLEVNRGTSILGNLLSGDNNDGNVEVDIETTDAVISLVDLSTGATINVDACAIDSSRLKVDASTGAQVNVNGLTTELDLDLSTGSLFNERADSFIVESVTFDMSTGSIANLCGASRVQGDASTGAIVYVDEGVDVSDVDLSIGADTSSKRCR